MQGLTEVRDQVWRRCVGDEVGDEVLLAGHVFAGDHGDLTHGRVFGYRGFDFARFDAVAANLDLLVDAAEVFEVAVLVAPGQVPAAVREPVVERIGQEPFRGQVGPVEVTGGDAGTGDVELAGHADCHRPEAASRT